MKKILVLLMLLSLSLSSRATHYINKTGRVISITNFSEKKRQHRKNMWVWGGAIAKRQKSVDNHGAIFFITLKNDEEGDLDNKQDDEVRITSEGLSDHRKMFPTNNSFNYVITLNKYKNKYERFDINHAGQATEGVKSSKKYNNKHANKISIKE